MRLKLFAVVAIAAVVALRASAGGMLAWTGDTMKWMAEIPDDTLVGGLTIPCSHDSGMVEGCASYVTPSGIGIEGLFLNQDLTVGDQLAAGARWIELRPELHDGELLCFHRTSNDVTERLFGGGVGGCGLSFRRVFAETAEFLGANPSETVIFEFSTSKMKERSGDVKALMAEFDGLFYKWTSKDPCPSANALPLGAVRGKVIAVLRWTEPDPANGVWGEIEDGDTAPGYLSVTGSSAGCVDFATMRRTQLEQWEALKDLDPAKSAMWMPFVLTWEFDLFDLGNSNRKLAEQANPHLDAFLREGVARFGKKPGYVNLDYLTPALCRTLIAYNFPDDWTAHPLNPSGDGAFVAPARTTEYLGTLVDSQARAAVGTVSVKVTKPDRRGLVTVTATVKTAADGQMFSYRAKGVPLPGEGPLSVALAATNGKSAAHAVRVVLGADSLSGTVDGTLEIDGARNVFKERKDPRRGALAPFAGTWNGWLSAAGGTDAVPFSAKVGTSGSVSVKGWIGGAAYSCMSKAEVGEGVIAVPVVWRKKVKGEQVSLAFRLMLDLAGGQVFVRDISREGFDFEDAGRPALDRAAFKALPVRVYPRTGSVGAANALSYAAKTGVISGSLKLSSDGRSKAKKAYGVVIGAAGVGTAELDGVRVLFRVGLAL